MANAIPGRNLVCIGGPAATTVGAGAQAVITLDIKQSAILAKLIVQCIDGLLEDITVLNIEHSNTSLMSGEQPATTFGGSSMTSPILGTRVLETSNLQVTVFNNNAATRDVVLGFTVA